MNSEQMMFLLQEAGYEITGQTDGVDAVVINTCGFIESAQQEAVDVILEMAELKAQGRIGKIIVAGCLAQRFGTQVADELPEIDALVGVGSFQDVVSAVRGAFQNDRPVLFGDIDAPDTESGRVFTTSGIWEYIKIAEGCDNRCAYCTIPDIRGRFRSRPVENIVSEARKFAERGVRELIVVAQDITRYGIDLYGKRSLSRLLRELAAIDGIDWIRLHYLYPDEIDDELIDLIANNDKILKYLDIPIQHINDSILKSMCRRGTGQEIRELFRKLRDRIDGVVIRTSIITGLPGEGETEFEELCEFLREAKLERAGVFPFSPEEGTRAAAMEHPDADT
ncbi:MAG: 30S ribosomal protein S12 methylthiotransferase RimO, partial [Clostridiales bacterium]|nr:30S ribosomal protein S12 methylthiotransferase RimO [Clostridiales bacterium]